MDSAEAKEVLVHPFYLELIHGWKFDDDDPRGNEMLEHMRRTAKIVSDHDATALWHTGWREAAMASWWASAKKWEGCEHHIRHVLSPSFEWYGYDGLLHFVALDHIASPEAAEIVAECLGRPEAPTYAFALIAAHSLHLEMYGYGEQLSLAGMSEYNPSDRQRYKRLVRLSIQVAN